MDQSTHFWALPSAMRPISICLERKKDGEEENGDNSFFWKSKLLYVPYSLTVSLEGSAERKLWDIWKET